MEQEKRDRPQSGNDSACDNVVTFESNDYLGRTRVTVAVTLRLERLTNCAAVDAMRLVDDVDGAKWGRDD